MTHTDMTRTAGSLTIGEVVADSDSFERLVIDQMNPPAFRDQNGAALTEEHVTFLAHAERTGTPVIRCWPTVARVTVTSDTVAAQPETPKHLRPDACYVCGGEKHDDTAVQGGHNYWSNADAARHFNAEDARLSLPGHKEAAYVAQHRPY